MLSGEGSFEARDDPRGTDPESEPIPFETPAALRTWFARHHLTATELWIRFFKLDSGKPSVTYPEALDEALCVGWIDGIRKGVDDESYLNRFTPRKRNSNWSAVNIQRVEALIADGRMRPAGLAAFEGREASVEQRRSYEQRPHDLPTDALSAVKKDRAAWSFWREQPAGYRRAVAWWIVSAKRRETRAARIALLVNHARNGERIPPFLTPGRRKR